MNNGTHLIVDCSDVPYEICVNDALLLETLAKAAKRGGATVINTSRYRFGHNSPAGCAVFVLLDESHVSMHTYADTGKAALDIFTCGANANTKKILDIIVKELGIDNFKLETVKRFSHEPVLQDLSV